MSLVARRELTERVRERSFLVGTCVSIAIIALVVVLPPLLGFDEEDRYTVGTVGPLLCSRFHFVGTEVEPAV